MAGTLQGSSLMRINALVIVIMLSLGLDTSAQGVENSITTIYLPRPAETVPGIRIGWFINDFTGAAQSAQSQKEMLVVVFREDNCGWCALQLAHVLRCEAFNELAGRAVFDIETPSFHLEGGELARGLSIDSYPAISVIAIKGGNMEERYRLIGFNSVSKLLPELKKALKLGSGPLHNGSKAAKQATEIYYGAPTPYCADDAQTRARAPYSTPTYRP